MGKQFAFQVTIYFVFWLKHNLILFNRIRRRFHHFLGVLIPIHHFCGSFVSALTNLAFFCRWYSSSGGLC